MDAIKNWKVYVRVAVVFDENGAMIPKSLQWEDGKKYVVDRVTEVKQAAAMRSGGQGDRYTIWVNGKQSYLFFERNSAVSGNCIGKWFVERKAA